MPLDSERVRPAVEARMAELGIKTQDELARRADVHVETLRDLLLGRRASFKRVTLAQIAAALDWVPDAIEKISSGAELYDVDRGRLEEALQAAAARARDLMGREQTLEGAAARSGVDISDLSDEDQATILEHIEFLRSRRRARD